MEQHEILKSHVEIKERLRLFNKKTNKEREEIIDEWKELHRKCKHPNKQGRIECYCPDCGQSWG